MRRANNNGEINSLIRHGTKAESSHPPSLGSTYFPSLIAIRDESDSQPQLQLDIHLRYAALIHPTIVFMIILFRTTAFSIAKAPQPALTKSKRSCVRELTMAKCPERLSSLLIEIESLYQRAFGDRQLEPTREPMTIDTVFDLASLTKPIATATSVMCLVQCGMLDVDDPVATYLPEFAVHGKASITVRDLLLHVGGLIPDNSIGDYR